MKSSNKRPADTFQSKDLELSFFECAPAHEVLRYVDTVAPHMVKDFSPVDGDVFRFECGKQLEQLMFARNDNIIDIALARIASPPIVASIFERHVSRKPTQPYEAGVRAGDFSSSWDHYKVLQEKEDALEYYDRLACPHWRYQSVSHSPAALASPWADRSGA